MWFLYLNGLKTWMHVIAKLINRKASHMYLIETPNSLGSISNFVQVAMDFGIFSFSYKHSFCWYLRTFFDNVESTFFWANFLFLDILEINIEIYDPFHVRISIIWFLKGLIVLKICCTSFTMSLNHQQWKSVFLTFWSC